MITVKELKAILTHMPEDIPIVIQVGPDEFVDVEQVIGAGNTPVPDPKKLLSVILVVEHDTVADGVVN